MRMSKLIINSIPTDMKSALVQDANGMKLEFHVIKILMMHLASKGKLPAQQKDGNK